MEIDFSRIKPAIEPIKYIDGVLYALDQRKLPLEESWLELRSLAEVIGAIKSLAVRGAPLLGIVAGYGLIVGMQEVIARGDRLTIESFERILLKIASSRPTARNLFDSIEKMRDTYDEFSSDEHNLQSAIELAESIHEYERINCIEIAKHSLGLLRGNVLTHCNTGVLATGGIGTALGAIHAGFVAGNIRKIWVDETRPLLQGARLTAWELDKLGIPHEIICDSAAGSLMANGDVDCVITGADRIAANGDTANKIGTYGLAVLCHHHQLPFYIAAPSTTIDESIETGRQIVIEFREAEEIRGWGSSCWASRTSSAHNPAFDITPAELITAIITERGVYESPSESGINIGIVPSSQDSDAL